MKVVIFGLTISSSWGNGHATLWRGLCRALIRRGDEVVFFERDVPYYAAHRDLFTIQGGELVLYSDWNEAQRIADTHLRDCAVAIVTSYCPDGIAATDLVLSSSAAVRVFYDMDTPVTLARWRNGEALSYIGPEGLEGFDLVLSYTGGGALEALQAELKARRVAPLYGSVDPEVHHPVAPEEQYRADLSYLGTYAEDRQEFLDSLFIEPARQLPDRRFLIGGAQYPREFPWVDNIFFVRHVPPASHPAFFCSSEWTLNVTRRAMVEMGYCPSGRLFEAAACGTPIVSDGWEGLDQFFQPGEEILVARNTSECIEALKMPASEREKIAMRARDRVLAQHTSEHRVQDLMSLLESTMAMGSSGTDAPGLDMAQAK